MAEGSPRSEPLALRWTRSPRDPCWELHTTYPPAAFSALLGWVLSRPPEDAGVPRPIAMVIARALCAVARLTFLRPLPPGSAAAPGWQALSREWIRVLEPDRAGWLRRRPAFPLACTGAPEVACDLFYVPEFPWELRGQLALLSPLDAPPPDLSYEQLEYLTGGRAIEPERLAAAGPLEGLLFPGPDGDFAEFIWFQEPAIQAAEAALDRACAAAGLDWQILSEAEFRSTAWFPGRG